MVFISRMMSFVPAWIVVASGLRKAVDLAIYNVSSVVYPEKLSTLTMSFFIKLYSFKPFTIESLRIITFFLGSLYLSALLLLILCGGLVSLMVCGTLSISFFFLFLGDVPFVFDFQKAATSIWILFCFTSESFYFMKFNSGQTKVLKFVNSSYKRFIGERWYLTTFHYWCYVLVTR